MSKIMLIIDKPDSCWDCPCLDGEMSYCHLTNKGIGAYHIGREKDCPLRPLPEKRDDEDLNEYHRDLYADGWNNCLDEIMGETK